MGAEDQCPGRPAGQGQHRPEADQRRQQQRPGETQHRRQRRQVHQPATAVPDGPVQTLRPGDIGPLRRYPNRFVADHVAVLENRRHVGADPVVIAVLGPVFYDAHPGPAGLEVIPHVFEHRLRHVRMADDVVGLAQQFLAGKTAYFDEFVVAVGDHAFQIGGGDQTAIRGHFDFALSDGQVLAHGWCLHSDLGNASSSGASIYLWRQRGKIETLHYLDCPSSIE